MPASATFALKAGLWFRRMRLVRPAPASGNRAAFRPKIHPCAMFKFSESVLVESGMHHYTVSPGEARYRSMTVLKRNNVTVHGAQGPFMVYAHGFGCDHTMWNRVAEQFSTTHRVVLFDYVGSGRSDITAFDNERYGTLSGYVQDLLDVCDALELTSGVSFIGHSVSCSVGLLASVRRPCLFDRLILLGPSPSFLNHRPEYEGGFEQQDLEGLLALMDQNYMGWANYLAPIVAGEDGAGSVSAELSDSFCSTDPVAARVFAQTTFFADNRADLQYVKTPSLILQHRYDALAPLSVGTYMHDRLEGSELEILDVAGHCAHMSHPDLVTAAIRRYLAADNKQH